MLLIYTEIEMIQLNFFTVITLQNIIKESLTLINTKNLCVGSVIFIIINQSETYHIQLL